MTLDRTDTEPFMPLDRTATEPFMTLDRTLSLGFGLSTRVRVAPGSGIELAKM